MTKKKKAIKNTPAKSMDNFLIAILIILVVLIFGGTYLAYTNLTLATKEASDAIAKLQEDNAPLQNVEELATQNQQYADVLQIVPRMTIPADDIQSVATNDINKYARLTGIRISSTTYGKGSSESLADASGQQSKPVNTITIESTTGVPMKSVLQFIKLIENNLPVMYLTEINLDSPSGNTVIINSMTIGVAVK